MMVEIPLKRRGITYCDECKFLVVLNHLDIYAWCNRHKIAFKPFEDDTRTHYCAWAERREP